QGDLVVEEWAVGDVAADAGGELADRIDVGDRAPALIDEELRFQFLAVHGQPFRWETSQVIPLPIEPAAPPISIRVRQPPRAWASWLSTMSSFWSSSWVDTSSRAIAAFM